MAKVISNEEAVKGSFDNYPSKCTTLDHIQKSGAVFVIGQVVSLKRANANMEEPAETDNVFIFVELSDSTGNGFVKLDLSNDLDTVSEREIKIQNIKFFEERVDKFVYLLNAKVKKQNNLKKRVLSLNQWSQIREVFDNQIIESIQHGVSHQSQKQQNNQKKQNEPKKIMNINEVNPNHQFVNVQAKIVEVIEFKRLRGFYPDESLSADGNPQDSDSFRVVFQDLSGKIYGVFPKLPKFEKLLKVGSVVELDRAKIKNFQANEEGEFSIYVTVHLMDEKNPKFKGNISLLAEGSLPYLEALPVITSTPGAPQSSDTSNISRKIWMISSE